MQGVCKSINWGKHQASEPTLLKLYKSNLSCWLVSVSNLDQAKRDKVHRQLELANNKFRNISMNFFKKLIFKALIKKKLITAFNFHFCTVLIYLLPNPDEGLRFLSERTVIISQFVKKREFVPNVCHTNMNQIQTEAVRWKSV